MNFEFCIEFVCGEEIKCQRLIKESEWLNYMFEKIVAEKNKLPQREPQIKSSYDYKILIIARNVQAEWYMYKKL